MLRGSEKFGPYTRSELKAMATAGNVVSGDLIWKEGLKAAVRADTLPDLSFAEPSYDNGSANAGGNPYRAPGAAVADVHHSAPGSFGTEARRVPAGHGSQWLGEAWDIFKQSWLTWTMALVVMWVCLGIVAMVPVLGSIAQALLSPVFAGGLIAMAHATSNGESADINHLFDGFRQKFGPLVVLGLINIGLMLALAVVVLIAFFMVLGVGVLGNLHNPAALLNGSTLVGIWFIMVILVIGIALFASANWLAPSLIMLSNMSPTDALGSSFRASWRNWLPGLNLAWRLVLIGLGAVILVSAPSVAAYILVSSKVLGFLIGGIMALVFGITFLAFVPISTYTSFRDLYGHGEY